MNKKPVKKVTAAGAAGALVVVAVAVLGGLGVHVDQNLAAALATVAAFAAGYLKTP